MYSLRVDFPRNRPSDKESRASGLFGGDPRKHQVGEGEVTQEGRELSKSSLE